ncbi:MAG TPA: CoA transferase, partial [Mycobacterium sp.]
EKLGIDPHELARSHPGLVHVSVTCYGSTGPWARRGGFDMNGSAASGLMVIEGGVEQPALPPTGLINDFITGYMGALGAAAGLIRPFRTDFARVEAGWLTAVALKLSVAGSEVAAVGRTLVRYPESRFCVAIMGGGAASIFVTMQLHHVSDLGPVILRLSAEHPGVTVLDSRVVLRCVKSWGRLLGLDGRAHDVVPVDLWASANQG